MFQRGLYLDIWPGSKSGYSRRLYRCLCRPTPNCRAFVIPAHALFSFYDRTLDLPWQRIGARAGRITRSGQRWRHVRPWRMHVSSSVPAIAAAGERKPKRRMVRCRFYSLGPGAWAGGEISAAI
ncbi:hypothetical protein HBI56_177360 [Parastagonospora nodorum]|uniref:Uncharacterized protein n=1 Tax=Phaeosphaeria nodorum (strain SN15 / ATCC MYA-4574 / FGSC 10173) TaxID=321614 RepID=A0A7U2HXP1_PHANO|nr:hypothetical protein HBH56_047950 [Parastagonospora nodorum]QRC92491.1 hypothetical protein JI435_402570 [Parastagonospora nodorum SN15]KAH3933298.1 hypothetical protein HBH54_075690 [Parastagonospora nodorum]KAH3938842.1 hypothetical protein HBH53_243900 [Parastagonospora nodorum]KAH3957349.1 hypothetical protein HBH51_227060 [Parastagonospora nodorum]